MFVKPNPSELLKSSVRSILKNKSRTILTSLGIIIGVTSVILLTSIGTGLKSYVSDQFESLGANSVYVMPGQVFSDSGSFSQGGGGMLSNKFTLKDVEAVEKQFKNMDVMPFNTTYANVKSNKKTRKSIEINGTTYEYGPNNNLIPSEGNGRWFTKEEVDKKTPVIVLGHKIANDLYPNGNALGKNVYIKGKTLKVIGVLDAKGGMAGMDDLALIPITVAYNVSGNQDISTIIVQAPDKDSVAKLKKDLNNFMKERYDEDAFSVFDNSQLLSSINSIISVLTIALSGIAAISLVVGGIGIMNIMLVSVTERTREIGLRKAIGAYPRAILLQFIIEAIILSCLGGGIGILLGYLGSLAINSFFPAKVTLSSVILAFGVSSLVGIIFGVAPARKASKLSPIEALRYE